MTNDYYHCYYLLDVVTPAVEVAAALLVPLSAILLDEALVDVVPVVVTELVLLFPLIMLACTSRAEGDDVVLSAAAAAAVDCDYAISTSSLARRLFLLPFSTTDSATFGLDAFGSLMVTGFVIGAATLISSSEHRF